MKNLGKIVVLIFLLQTLLFGDIRASVDSTNVELGDTVTLSLSLSGDKIQKPIIHSLCNSDITSTGSQTSIEIINGSYQKNYILTYTFLPQNSCVIPPIEIEIDGKKVKSQKIKLKVGVAKSSKDADFQLQLLSDKKEVLKGESFKITLLLKQKNGASAVDSKFIPPIMKGFWVKDESKPIRYQDGDYLVTKIIYTIAGQREGTLKVSKAQLKIASRSNARDRWNSFMSAVKWKTYFSNDLDITIKPLPQGVDLIGDFAISASVDKDEIGANEAVNVEIKITGTGNLEDIKGFKPFIDGVSVFDEKIATGKTSVTQKIAFVSDSNFTIPAFSIKYFDKKTKEIKTISTKEINIKVKNAKKKEDLVIKKQNPAHISNETRTFRSDKISNVYIAIASLIGFVLGVLLMITKPWNLIKKEKKTISLKDPKGLLIKLLEFKDDAEVKEIVDILEKNIYHGGDVKLDKKMIKTIISRYGIS